MKHCLNIKTKKPLNLGALKYQGEGLKMVSLAIPKSSLVYSTSLSYNLLKAVPLYTRLKVKSGLDS